LNPDKYPEIRDLPLFASISTDSFDTLIRGAYVQNYPPMTELITEGDSADFLHIVLAGSVELFAGWKDRETTLSIQGPVSMFILAATIRDRPYLMSARTLEKTRIIMIPSQDVRAVFESDSDFAKSIVFELAGFYRDSIKNNKNLKLRTSIERLANYLLKCHRDLGAPDSFVLETEKRRIASLLGMTPENLSRSFASLKPHGVEVDGQTVVITDPAGFRDFAQPSDLIDS